MGSQSDAAHPLARGAFVWKANISGAKNVDDQLRRYLCLYGALNVPGSCVGIERLDIMRKDESSFGSSCF